MMGPIKRCWRGACRVYATNQHARTVLGEGWGDSGAARNWRQVEEPAEKHEEGCRVRFIEISQRRPDFPKRAENWRTLSESLNLRKGVRLVCLWETDRVSCEICPRHTERSAQVECLASWFAIETRTQTARAEGQKEGRTHETLKLRLPFATGAG